MGPETGGCSERRNKWPRPRPLAVLSAAMILLQACAPPYVDEKTREGFGRIGLVSASFAPEIEIPEFVSAEGGAAIGIVTGGSLGALTALVPIWACFLAPPACPAVAPYVLGGAAAGGAVGAAIGSADEETVIAVRKSLGPVIEKQLVQDALRARVMAYAEQNGLGRFAVIDDPRPSTPEEFIDYRPLSADGIDTVLETRLLHLKFRKMSLLSDNFRPIAVAQARVIRVRDQTVLKTLTYGVWGEEAVLDTWVEDRGRRIQAWAAYAYATLAEYILFETILGYRYGSDEVPRGLVGLTGHGLRPEFPALNATVDTLRPDFRWEPLDGAKQSADDKTPENIQDVKYEIQIFAALRTDRYLHGIELVPELLGGPIYSSSALVNPRHRIDKSLAPCTKYFWTVRARFRIDGQLRLTEWANLNGGPWQLRRLTQGGTLCYFGYAACTIRRPTDFYLPFQTRCPANAGAN